MFTRYIAPPISRMDIRNYTERLRSYYGFEKSPYFPIVHFLEYVVFSDEWGYSPEIRPYADMLGVHAETDLQNKIMRIREDVYIGACEDRGRDRMTLAHELGHILLHEKPTLARVDPEIPIEVRAYRDAEWQATAFAGELLIPYPLVKNHTEHMIAEECKVSLQAARYQLEKFK